jgi:hypothetical protein
MTRSIAAVPVWLAMLAGCSSTVLVAVPPRVELKDYATLGIIQFASNAEPAVEAIATRQFQEAVQAAQPGTRFVELGTRQAALAAVGAKTLDAAAVRKLAAKHGVDAIFIGELTYAEPKADFRLSNTGTLGGSLRAELRGDISARLMEASSGASVWSSSAWAKRQLGSVRMSSDETVSAAVSKADPRREMVPALVFHLTQDFRPSTQAISAARR